MKNKILTLITTLAALSCILGMLLIDSKSVAPVVMIGISLLWLIPFYYANRDRLGV